MSNEVVNDHKERVGESLRITEIFYSLQGEADTVGWPTLFIRLTGCPLRCQYCDTEYAFHGGKRISLDDIVAQAQKHTTLKHITVSGGEPLAQPAVILLMKRLCDLGYAVSLETSGALDISKVDDRVSRVVDIKTPDSGEVSKNRWQNMGLLQPNDQLKFVLCSRADYDWAKQIIEEHQLLSCCPVLFSPSFEQIKARELADWIVVDQLPVRFQLQLHKILWNDEPGR
ncbi:MAG: 7-carboxy-7-deazaguanine synthase QueE [Coxiellaceae bacterium]|nr:7-carboxy-7-deazaguanine synthase QueE [Coxiellaceae bacterium]